RTAPQPEQGYTSYRIGVGHSHGARPPSIVGAITGEGGLDGKDVGKISIFGNFALVQIRGELTEEQLARIGRARVGGRALRIGPDMGPRGGGKGPAQRRDGDRPRRREGERGPRRDRDSGGRRDAGARGDAKRKS